MYMTELLATLQDLLFNWLVHGLGSFSGWQIVAYTLVTTHITIAAVTIFLHRSQAHRSVELHALPAHFFRCWLWLSTGIVTREWVAVHRKHHSACKTPQVSRSPQTRGIAAVLLRGSELSAAAAEDQHMLDRFGTGTPDDWFERKLYTPHSFLGVGHWSGYRDFETADESRNIMPWGIVIGGEELHNNHHTYPTTAKLSVCRHEFNFGWGYIRGLEMLGLATVRHVRPQLRLGSTRPVHPGVVRGRAKPDACRAGRDARTIAAAVEALGRVRRSTCGRSAGLAEDGRAAHLFENLRCRDGPFSAGMGASFEAN